MRLATAFSAAVLALSTAALAQVASTPAEQKVPGNDMLTNDNSLAGPPNSAAPADGVEPVANDMAPLANSAEGDPAAASTAPRKQ
jgi:hypothetical protein